MIRSATGADIPGMIELFRRHHAAMGCDWAVDLEQLQATFAAAIAAPAQWLCLTGDGCLLLAMWFENPLGAGRLATEFCFCAPPALRDELIDAYERWARARHCRKVSLTFMRRFEASARLFGRRGYALDEMTLSKVL